MAVILSRKGGGGGSGAPTGPAGGDLAGTYPNPTISDQGSADGAVITSDGAGGTAFEYPPGYELAYAEITNDVSVTATTSALANTVVSAGAVTLDGSTRIRISFFSASVETGITAGSEVYIILYDSATELGYLGSMGLSDGTRRQQGAVYTEYIFTPSAAAHTYIAKAYRATANGTIRAGNGTQNNFVPAFIRITVA